MAEIAVNRLSDFLFSVIEDPTLANNRIFINGQSYNATTLSPNFQEMFHYNRSDKWSNAGDNWVNIGGATYYNGLNVNSWDLGTMSLEKGTIQCFSAQSDMIYQNNFVHDTYHHSMDNTYYPVKRSFKTLAGNNIMSISQPYWNTSVYSSMINNTFYYRSDIAGYNSNYFNSAANSNSVIDQVVYEDTTNMKLWGYSKKDVGIEYINVWNLYDTPSAVQAIASPFSTAAGQYSYFMGVDSAGSLWFLRQWDDTNVNANRYTIVKISPTSYAVTVVLDNSTRGLGEGARNSRPSNIRRPADNRRVFYSSHYDNNGWLSPIRYIWDTTGASLLATNCTMYYPGSDFYQTHADKFVNTGATTNGNSLTFSAGIKGHQFSTGGVDYITYFVTDMAVLQGSGSTRFSIPARRTALTYSIGANVPATLTNGIITGTLLTYSGTNAALSPGMVLTGTGVSASTSLVSENRNNITTFVISGTAGQFTCASTTLATNQAIQIVGTYGGTGSILGYISGNTYYIQTGGTGTSFTLLNSPSGTAALTTAGTPTGITVTGVGWNINNTQTVASTNITATPIIATLIGAAISGTTLTFASSTGSAVVVGMIVSGIGVLSNTYIVSGSSLSWVLNQTQNVNSTTMTATQGAASFTGVIANGATATITAGVVTGDRFTLTSSTGATIVPGMVLSGGTYPGGYIVSGSGLSWIISPSAMVAAQTVTTATPSVLTASGPVIGNIAVGMILSGGTTSLNTIISAVGTGVGGVGTYYVYPAQNVASNTTTGYLYTDDRLNYHSKLVHLNLADLPRNWIPMNNTGTQLAVPTNEGLLRFYNFNSTTGWVPTGPYPIEFRQLGLDQNNRLWGTGKEKGYNSIHVITPTMPITITAVMAATSYTYTGSNISTTAAVNAWGTLGQRLASPVTLTIDGASMIFTSTGTKTLTVTTSDSADTTVNLTINGGGISNIIASVSV